MTGPDLDWTGGRAAVQLYSQVTLHCTALWCISQDSDSELRPLRGLGDDDLIFTALYYEDKEHFLLTLYHIT